MISVVVPTRDRPDGLARCLAALAGQTCADRLEIVVVDDGSQDGGQIEARVSHARRRYVRLEGTGPASARNAGIRAARGRVVCFTDDDCEPEPDWAARLVGAIEAGRATASAGQTLTPGPADSFAQATQLIVDHLVESSRRSAELVGFAPSCNLACRADVLREIPFDERFPSYGEDRDWCARLLAAGHTLHWEAGAVVLHHQRLDLGRFVRKHVQYGEGAYRFRRSNPSAGRLEPAAFYVGLLRTAAGRGVSTAAAVCLAQAATAAGFAAAALTGSRS
jgi:glycosyltransferase involved in cell wall biosynthesis